MGVLSVLTAVIFLGAALVPLLQWLLPKASAWLAPIPAFAAFVVFFTFTGGGPLPMESRPWMPEIGLQWSLGLDGFRLLFALLITGIGFLVILYSGHYGAGRSYGCRMTTMLYLFMGSMLGLVLSQNLLLVVIFWELTSLSSFFLIGLRFDATDARKAAQRALIITGLGGLFLLVGVIGLGQHFGSYELAQIRGHIQDKNIPVWAVISILAGCLTKSAQFPFHGWLPGAMTAPTPVSSYLHSATMVKAGVFLLAVLNETMRGVVFWGPTLIFFGTATVFVSAVALYRRDLKQILAYSTVGSLGLMVILIGIGTPQAIYTLSAVILTHALYKATLFLCSGTIDRQQRTRDVATLHETGVGMPLMRLAVGAASLSMAGIPLFLGFATKELVYETWLHSPAMIASSIGVLVSGVLTGAIAWRTFRSVVLPNPVPLGELRKEVPGMQVPVAIIAAVGLLAGCFVPYLNRILATYGGSEGGLQVLLPWYGFDGVLALSLTSVALGIVIGHHVRTREHIPEDREFLDSVFFAIHRISRVMVKTLQTGHLRRYIQLTLIALLVLVGVGIWRIGGLRMPAYPTEIEAHELVVTLAIVSGAVGAVIASNRLRAIVSLGVVGFGIAAIYIMFGAPDLAMTQIFVETLTVILFVLIFYHMPKFSRLSSQLGRRFDALLACGVGGMMACLTIVAANQQHRPSIGDWHAQHALADGNGRNIVNVLLVDFRGLDTMGEITVLGVAAIGVYAILRLKPRKEERS